MARKDPSDCVVTVTIEVGHQAQILKEPSPEGFTHDWTVFVRGQDGNKLEAFVEKVVFKLHKTFKCPIRTISAPPYKVTESGYAGFILPIEIYFKNKQCPRRILFNYDLFLNAKDSPPINNVRVEKLKFQNPTPDFKEKLLKAGGVEQGADTVSHTNSEQIPTLIKTELKKSPKKSKEKEKKKKKKSPPKSKSPDVSLSSLSSLSSSSSDDEPNLPPPPPPPKKEKKEQSHKKESSHSKHEHSSVSQSDIDKHRNISHKDRHISETGSTHKSHKHKSKDKDVEKRSSSKSKDNLKKDKEILHKEKEASYSLSKSSEEKKIKTSSSHKEKEKSFTNLEKEKASNERSEKHSSSSKESRKSSSSHKSKHSSHREHDGSSAEKKAKLDINEFKVSKEKLNLDAKSRKRSPELPEDMIKRKKLKRSISVTSNEEKVKSEPGNDKHNRSHKSSKENDAHKSKEEKESKSSSSSKSKQEKIVHSERHKHNSDSKHKDKSSSSKDQDSKHKSDKLERMTKSEHLAMTADFQPKLLLSPLKDKSSDEGSHELSPENVVEKIVLKRTKSISSHSSLSSTHDLEKSDTETHENNMDRDKNIISGLTDSDSDSENDAVINVSKSPSKENKAALVKPLQPDINNSKHASKMLNHASQDNRRQNMNIRQDKNTNLDNLAKIESKKTNNDKLVKSGDDKSSNDKGYRKDCDKIAPNGFLFSELMTISDTVQKAQLEANLPLINKVVDIIADTDDFDMNDHSVYFDICSLKKSVVEKIQAVLKKDAEKYLKI